MNWLIWERMFTYSCKKFRPVNCMHYIKCSINSFITHIILVAAEGPWYLGSLFYHDSYYSQYVVNYRFTLVPYSGMKVCAQAFVTFCALIHCALSLTARQTKMAAEFPGFRWPVLVMAPLKPRNICCSLSWSSNQSGMGQSSLLSASSIKFLTKKCLKS